MSKAANKEERLIEERLSEMPGHVREELERYTMELARAQFRKTEPPKMPHILQMWTESAYDQKPTKTKSITFWYTPNDYVELRERFLESGKSTLHEFMRAKFGLRKPARKAAS